MRYQKDRVSSNHLFCVPADGRDALVEKVALAGIEAGVHYQRVDSFPMYEPASLPETRYFAERQVSLPMHLLLRPEDVDLVCDTIEAGW